MRWREGSLALWDGSVKLTRGADRKSPPSQTVFCKLLVNYGVCPVLRSLLRLCVCAHCKHVEITVHVVLVQQPFPHESYMNASSSYCCLRI